MKKITHYFIFFIVLILSITAVKSQEKCKYDIDKKDPFTGKNIRKIQTTIKSSPVFLWMLGLEKIGDDYDLAFFLGLRFELVDNLEKGDSVMFKFANDEIVTCYARDQVSPGALLSIQTCYDGVYPISVEKLKTFTTSLATNLRVNIGVNVYQIEIDEKTAKKLMKSAVCIMQ